MSKVQYRNEKSDRFDDHEMLFAGFSAPVKGDFGGIFKISTSENPIPDLTGQKYIGANLRIDTSIDMPEDQKIQLIMIIESEPAPKTSGDTGTTIAAGAFQSPGNSAKTISVFEGIANISPNKDEKIYFDISSWDGDKAHIKKIKLLVNPYASSSSYSHDSSSSLSLNQQILYPLSPVPAGGDSENSDIMGKYDFNLYVYSIISARSSRMAGFQTFFTVIFIIVFILVAAYAALYIRARIIKKKRREQRELQQKQKRAQAIARARGLQPGQQPIPPQYRISNNNNNQNQNQRPPQNNIPRGGNNPPGNNIRGRNTRNGGNNKKK
jgi:hypothetical protein